MPKIRNSIKPAPAKLSAIDNHSKSNTRLITLEASKSKAG